MRNYKIPFNPQAQGANHRRVQIKANGFFETGGLWLVSSSRTTSIKHIYIEPEDMPNHLDVRLQRLDIDVIDAQAFFRELKINAAVTFRKQVALKPGLYGESWTEEENNIADEINTFWRDVSILSANFLAPY